MVRDTVTSLIPTSKLYQELVDIGVFHDRSLAELNFPYVFLDATYCKARLNHRVVSQAIVAAVGVAADGRREVLGFDVGDTENEAFWTGFLRTLNSRGLGGVKLVMSDAHSGLKKATGTAFQGASWQRCRVHFMRNVLAIVPKGSQDMVASIIRTVFAQPDREHIRSQFHEATTTLDRSHPKVAAMRRRCSVVHIRHSGFPGLVSTHRRARVTRSSRGLGILIWHNSSLRS